MTATARISLDVTVCSVLVLFLLALPGKAQTITATTFEGPSSNPTVIVDGSGFGSEPVADPVSSGPPEADFENGQLFFNDDASPAWQAGYPGNSLGLILSSYTPTQVVFGFGSALTGNNPAYSLNEDDPYRVSVNGAASSGTVNFSLAPVITSTTFEGPSSNPTVIVDGFNFGSAPVADQIGSGQTGADFEGGQFYFVNDTNSWQAGSPGNGLGLTLLSYTPTEVAFGFGSGLTGSDPSYFLNENNQFRVAVGGATFDAQVAFVSPEPSTWLLFAVGCVLFVFVKQVAGRKTPAT